MIKTKVLKDILIVNLKGRLDIHTNKGVADELNSLASKNSDMHFVLDFGKVEYLSSSGIGLLVTLQRQLSANNKELRLCGVNTAVNKIFGAVGMLENFNIYNNLDDALDNL